MGGQNQNQGQTATSPPQAIRSERKSDTKSLKNQSFSSSNPEKKTSNISSHSILASTKNTQRSAFNSLTKILPHIRHNGSMSSSNSTAKKKKVPKQAYEPLRLPEDILTIQAHSASTPVTELPYLLIAAHIGALPGARQFYPATSSSHTPLTVFRDMFVMTVDVRGYKPSSVRLSTEGHLIIIECLQSEVPQVVCTQTGTIDSHEKYIMDPTPRLSTMPVHTSFNYVQHRVKLPEDFAEEGLKVGMDDVSGHVVITGRLVHNQKSTFPEPWNKSKIVKKGRGPIVNTSSLNLSREDARKLAAWQAVQGKARDKSTELVNTSLLQYGRKHWLEKEGAKLRMIQHKALKNNIKRLTELRKNGTPSNIPSNADLSLKTPSQRQLSLNSAHESNSMTPSRDQIRLEHSQQNQNRDSGGGANISRTLTPASASASETHLADSSTLRFAPTPSTSPAPHSTHLTVSYPHNINSNVMENSNTPHSAESNTRNSQQLKSRDSHGNTITNTNAKVSFQPGTKVNLARKKSKADSQNNKKGKKKKDKDKDKQSNHSNFEEKNASGTPKGKKKGNKTPKSGELNESGAKSMSGQPARHEVTGSSSPTEDNVPGYIKEEVRTNMNYVSYNTSDQVLGSTDFPHPNPNGDQVENNADDMSANSVNQSSKDTLAPNSLTVPENSSIVINGSRQGSKNELVEPKSREDEKESLLSKGQGELHGEVGGHSHSDLEDTDLIGEQDKHMWCSLLHAASRKAAKRNRTKSPDKGP